MNGLAPQESAWDVGKQQLAGKALTCLKGLSHSSADIFVIGVYPGRMATNGWAMARG